MKIKSKQRSLLAGLLLGAAGIITAHAANSTIVTFSVDMTSNIDNGTFIVGTDTAYARGTFDGWASPGLALVQEGNGNIYTNSANDTDDANPYTMIWQYTYTDGGNTYYEGANPLDYANRCAALPATSGASLILPTPFFDDIWTTDVVSTVNFQVDMSQQIALGIFNPVGGYVAAYGGAEANFTNPITAFQCVLTNNPNILETNQYGAVTSNVWVGACTVSNTPYGKFEFKYVMTNTSSALVYEQPANVDSDYDFNNNRYFVVAGSPQTLPVANFSDVAYAPVVNVIFSVDMSAVPLEDPGYDPTTVTVNGTFNNWTVGIGCTNNPTSANPNLFTSSNIVAGVGQTIDYQFRYSDGNTIYDNPPGGGNRVYVVANSNPAYAPTNFFDNVSPNDLLSEDTTVTFSVDMTNAVSNANIPVTFDPANDPVYVNGDFSGWADWTPDALVALQGTEAGTSEIYSYSQVFPKGHARVVNYLWVFDDVDGQTGIQFEPGNNNHVRYLRTTNGVDVLPTDVWGAELPGGNRYAELKVGSVSMGKPAGGNVQLNWLGYPGLSLQSATNINGPWANVPSTDTQNSATVSTGPSQQYFRLNLVAAVP